MFYVDSSMAARRMHIIVIVALALVVASAAALCIYTRACRTCMRERAWVPVCSVPVTQ